MKRQDNGGNIHQQIPGIAPNGVWIVYPAFNKLLQGTTINRSDSFRKCIKTELKPS